MFKCDAFYIGCATPTETKRGVEGLQQPLRERYRGNVSQCEGYDVKVFVTPDSIFVDFPSAEQDNFRLPLSTLSVCAAVRCVDTELDNEGNRKLNFVPVHSVLTSLEPDTGHPAIFSVMVRRTEGKHVLDCHSFICRTTSDALHLVNATQTAHSALKKGFGVTGQTKFFIDQSNSIKIPTTSTGQRVERNKIYTYHEDYDTRLVNGENRTYTVGLEGEDRSYTLNTNTEAKTYTVQMDRSDYQRDHVETKRYSGEIRDNTYYVKADEVKPPTPIPAAHPDTVLVKLDAELPPPAPVQQQQTIVIDKPIIRQQTIAPPPKPKIVVNPVLIDPPKPPKVEPQTIYVDKPVFKEFPPPSPPPDPIVVENPIYIEPPKPPKQKPQKIIVDKPIVKDFPPPPRAPDPIVEVNPIVIEPPPYPEQKAQRIIVDKPIINRPKTPPPPPEPIIETRDVYIDPPEFPAQKPHKIVVEMPKFNPVKPAPEPPRPIIETKPIYIDPPAYPPQEPQKIIVEKPIIRDPGPPPPQPKPIVLEKPVEIPPPQWPRPEPQRIVIEKPIVRDPGPPPPQPPPIIVYKNVYIDPPPWPTPEPQRIVVEKPIIRQRGPPPAVPPPIIIEKPVPIDLPAPPPPEPQRIVVEKPVVRQVVQRPVVRRVVEEPVVTRRYQYPVTSGTYGYNYQYSRPANVRSSYVVQQQAPQRGLRRYAWSEVGDREYTTRWDSGDAGRFTRGPRLYGQPRDFRRTENQFLNERGFARTINGEYRATRGASSYTYGDAYRINDFRESPRDRRGSVSS